MTRVSYFLSFSKNTNTDLVKAVICYHPDSTLNQSKKTTVKYDAKYKIPHAILKLDTMSLCQFIPTQQCTNITSTVSESPQHCGGYSNFLLVQVK